nr:immunoglobulin heavy chain junction region [Macaca mulatta]
CIRDWTGGNIQRFDYW